MTSANNNTNSFLSRFSNRLTNIDTILTTDTSSTNTGSVSNYSSDRYTTTRSSTYTSNQLPNYSLQNTGLNPSEPAPPMDIDGNGYIDNQELLYNMKYDRRNGISTSEGVANFNLNYYYIDDALRTFDFNRDAEFTDREMVDALMRIRTSEVPLPQEMQDLLFAQQTITLQDGTTIDFNENPNYLAILDSMNKIDDPNNPTQAGDGVISTQEVLRAFNNIEQGVLDSGDPNVLRILSYNRNLERILNVYNDAKRQGFAEKTPTDREVLDVYLSMRSGIVTQEVLENILFVDRNSNHEKIDSTLDFFDSNRDGFIVPEEFIVALLLQNAFGGDPDMQPTIDALRDTQEYVDLADIIEAYDKNTDGGISQEEVVDLLLAYNSNGGAIRVKEGVVDNDPTDGLDTGDRTITLDDFELARILDLNFFSPELVGLVTGVDYEDPDGDGLGDGTISNAETTRGILNTARGFYPAEIQAGVTHILNKNPNAGEIIQLIGIIDQDQDATFSDQEVAEALVKLRRGELDGFNSSLVMDVLNENPNRDLLDTALSIFDPDGNGYVTDVNLAQGILEIRRDPQAQNGVSPGLQELAINVLGGDVNILEVMTVFDSDFNGFVDDIDFAIGSMVIRDPESNLSVSNALYSFLIDENEIVFGGNASDIEFAINTLDNDPASMGIVTADEFANNLYTAAQNDINILRDVLGPVIDIIYPNAVGLLQFVTDVDTNTADNVLNDNEVIDGVMNLRAGLIADPGADIVEAVLNFNPNNDEIIELITIIDEFDNGQISDNEFINAEISRRTGGFDAYNSSYVNYIMNKNPRAADLVQIIDLFDPDGNGQVPETDYINLMLNVNKGTQDRINPAVFDMVRAGFDPTGDYEAILAAFGANTIGDGTVTDRDFAYGLVLTETGGINPSTATMDLMKAQNATPGDYQIIENFFNDVDANNDGVIDSDEFFLNEAAAFATDANASEARKRSVVIPVLDILFSGGNEYQNLFDAIDTSDDGTIQDSELIDGLLALTRGDIVDPGVNIREAVLNSNNSYSEILDMIDEIDTGDGFIGDEEAAKAYLDWNKGTVFDPSRRAWFDQILSENDKAAEIEQVVNLYDSTSADGNLTRLELFRAKFQIRSGESNLRTLFGDDDRFNALVGDGSTLGYLDLFADPGDVAVVNQFIEDLDPSGDGLVSKEELLDAMLGYTNDTVTPTNEMLRTVGVDAVNNKYTDAVIDAARDMMIALDLNTDESLNDNEIAVYSLLIDSDVPFYNNLVSLGLVDALRNTQPRFDRIHELVTMVNTDGNNAIGDTEMTAAYNDFKAGTLRFGDNTLVDETTLDAVLSLNQKYAFMKIVWDTIDLNDNDVIDDEDALAALFEYKDGNLKPEFQSSNPEKFNSDFIDILDSILATADFGNGMNASDVISQFDALALSFNGDMHMAFNELLEVRAGEKPYDVAVSTLIDAGTNIDNIEAAQEFLDQWIIDAPPHYSAEMVNFNSLVGGEASKATTPITNSFGLSPAQMIQADNFINDLMSIKTGLEAGRYAPYNHMENLMETYPGILASLPGASAGVLAENFYETAQNLITDISAFLQNSAAFDDTRYEVYENTKNVIATLDSNSDNLLDTTEAIDGILESLQGNLSTFPASLVTEVLQTNENYTEILDSINIIDSNNTLEGDDPGEFNNTEIVDAIFKLKSGALTNPILTPDPRMGDAAFMAIFDQVIARGSDYSLLQTQFDQAASINAGSETAMMNYLLAVRDGTTVPPISMAELIDAMEERLDNWEQGAGAIYKIKFDDFFQKLKNREAVLSPADGFGGLNASQIQLINEISDEINAIRQDLLVDDDANAYIKIDALVAAYESRLIELPGESAGPLLAAFYGDETLRARVVSEHLGPDEDNIYLRMDVNDSGGITDADANAIINQLNIKANSPGYVIPEKYDVNQSGSTTPVDALTIITELGRDYSIYNFDKMMELIAAYDLDPTNDDLDRSEAVRLYLDYKAGNLPSYDSAQYGPMLEMYASEDVYEDVFAEFDEGGDGTIDNTDIALMLLKYRDDDLQVADQADGLYEGNPAYEDMITGFIEHFPDGVTMESSLTQLSNDFAGDLTAIKQELFLNHLSDTNAPHYVLAKALENYLGNFSAFFNEVDVDGDGSLSDDEVISAIINIRNGTITDPPDQTTIDSILGTNPNYDDIVETIDLLEDGNTDGIFTDNAILDAKLADRAGTLTTGQDNFLNVVLQRVIDEGLMPSYDQNAVDALTNIVETMDSAGNDGNITKLELFQSIFELRTGEFASTFSGVQQPRFDSAVNFVQSKASNADRIEANSIASSIDPSATEDGFVVMEELVQGLIDLNASGIDLSTPDFRNLLLTVSTSDNSTPTNFTDDPKLNTTIIDLATNMARALDIDTDGSLSVAELALYSIVIDANTSLNDNLVNMGLWPAVEATQANATEVRSLVDKINTDGDLEILGQSNILSDLEVTNAINLRNTGGLTAAEDAVFDEVIAALNPNYANLLAVYNEIDRNSNGIIEDDDVMEAIVKYKDQAVFDNQEATKPADRDDPTDPFIITMESVLQSNANYTDIMNQFNALALEPSLGDGSEGDYYKMLNAILEMDAGARPSTGYAALVNAMTANSVPAGQSKLEEYNNVVDSFYSGASPAPGFGSTMQSLAVKISSASSGAPNPTGFGLTPAQITEADNMIAELVALKDKMLVAGRDVTMFMDMEAIMDDHIAALDTFPGGGAGNLAEAFYNTAANLVTDIREYLNTGAESSFDLDYTDFTQMKALIDLVDVDQSGDLSDGEMVDAFLDDKINDAFAAFDPSLVSGVLSTNSGYNTLVSTYIVMDDNYDGFNMPSDGDENISDEELVESIFGFGGDLLQGAYREDFPEKTIPGFETFYGLIIDRMDVDVAGSPVLARDLQTAFNTLATEEGGDLPLMYNKLIEVRDGVTIDPRFDELVIAMDHRLTEWENGGQQDAIANLWANFTTALNNQSATSESPADGDLGDGQRALMNQMQDGMDNVRNLLTNKDPNVYSEISAFLSTYLPQVTNLPGSGAGPLAQVFYADVVAFSDEIEEFIRYNKYDVNNDGDIDSDDAQDILNNIGSGLDQYDVDGDSDVDAQDGGIVSNYVGTEGEFNFVTRSDFDQIQLLIDAYDTNSNGVQLAEALDLAKDHLNGTLTGFTMGQINTFLGAVDGGQEMIAALTEFNEDGITPVAINGNEVLHMLLKYEDDVLDPVSQENGDNVGTASFMKAFDAIMADTTNLPDITGSVSANQLRTLFDNYAALPANQTGTPGKGNIDQMKLNLFDLKVNNLTTDPYYPLVEAFGTELDSFLADLKSDTLAIHGATVDDYSNYKAVDYYGTMPDATPGSTRYNEINPRTSEKYGGYSGWTDIATRDELDGLYNDLRTAIDTDAGIEVFNIVKELNTFWFLHRDDVPGVPTFYMAAATGDRSNNNATYQHIYLIYDLNVAMADATNYITNFTV